MRLVDEADTAGAVCSLGWIKEKEEKREKIVICDVQSLLLQIFKT